MMNTMKIESVAFLVHTTTFLHNGEALGESKALQALTTELYTVKYLIIDRLLQKTTGEDPNTSFDLVADVGSGDGQSKRAQGGSWQL
jgi:hypothetical protein